MARIRLSEEMVDALKKVAALSDGQYSEYVEAVEKIEPASNPLNLRDQIKPLVSSLAVGTLDEITQMIFALSCSRVSNDVLLPEFLKDVENTLAEMHPAEYGGGTNLIERMLRVLKSEAFVVSSKASVLQREHQRILVKSKIISDCRPIFGHETDIVIGNVINHTLKISYIEDMERREFFVALDSQDLVELQTGLARAQFKAREIKTLMEKSGIRNIPV